MTRLLAVKKSFKLKSLHFVFIFFSLFLIIILNSCYKPAGQIGDEIQPDQSRLKVFYSDTSTVYAYSVPEDTVRSDELSRNQLGSIVDPVFGTTNASIYTQFALSKFNNDFGSNPVMDSLILSLYYNGSYGDTTTQLNLHVYEMTEMIYDSSIYYSNINKTYDPTDYANYSFVPLPHDSLVVDGDTLPPMLRVNLSGNPTLANKLLDASAADLENNNAFQEYFNGLYIVCDQVGSNGSILYFNLLETFSKLTIYYHNDSTDNLFFNFLINSNCAWVNKYEHDFTTGSSEFKQQVVNGDTALGKQQFYVQGLAGVRSIIKFPFVNNWNELGNVAVNEAKLFLTGSENPPYLGAPEQLVLFKINEDGTYTLLDDYVNNSINYFGGVYKSSSNQYQFRITQYIQDRISNPNEPDYGLYLNVFGSSINPQRFIINGDQPVSDTVSKLRLEIVYTDL